MYVIGQKFGTAYPPEAAIWCNENNAMIVQVDGGFEIQKSPEPAPVDAPPVAISSDTITIPDAELLVAASTAGEKIATWLIAKLEL